MSNWRNLNDVIQDLSMAQGSNVPASLEVIGNTPPILNIEEETQAGFRSCGDINYNTNPPDLSLIQQMLSMVSSKCDDQNSKVSNDNTRLISQKYFPTESKRENGNIRRNRIDKNVAMKSILEAQEKNTRAKQPNISNSPVSMFRRKITSNVSTISSPAIQSNRVTLQCQYTPSDIANEYYKKYLANSKLKEQNEDISPSVDQPIREIAVRKKRLTEVNCHSENRSLNSDSSYKLLHHRHLSLDNLEECIVCHLTAKHGYSFKVDDINSDNLKLKQCAGKEASSSMLSHVKDIDFDLGCTDCTEASSGYGSSP